MLVKLMRSALCACCTPALFRFSSITVAKSALASYSALGWRTPSIRPSSMSIASVRCGLRLSTVNGPATRTRFLSS
jgi:hypothetical protein